MGRSGDGSGSSLGDRVAFVGAEPSSSRRSPSFLPLVRGWLTHAKGTAMDDVARVILAIGSQEVAEEVLHLLDRSGRARVVATAADDRELAEAVRQLESVRSEEHTSELPSQSNLVCRPLLGQK